MTAIAIPAFAAQWQPPAEPKPWQQVRESLQKKGLISPANWIFFGALENATTQAAEYLTLVENLRAALDGDGLDLVFHPEFDVASGEIVAIEALTRWEDPELGMVPPERFITAAEKAGLVRQLDFQSLDAACAHLACLCRFAQCALLRRLHQPSPTMTVTTMHPPRETRRTVRLEARRTSYRTSPQTAISWILYRGPHQPVT